MYTEASDARPPEPRARPRSAHHSRRIINYSSATVPGPSSGIDYNPERRDHREVTSRRLTQAAKQRKNNRDGATTYLPPIQRGSSDDVRGSGDDAVAQVPYARSRPRTAKARLENGRSLSASGVRMTSASRGGASHIDSQQVRSVSAGRARNSQLQFNFETINDSRGRRPGGTTVVELSHARSPSPANRQHLVTAKRQVRVTYQQQSPADEHHMLDQHLPTAVSATAHQSQSSHDDDATNLQCRSPQLRRSTKAVAVAEDGLEHLGMRFLPRPPSAGKARRSLSASADRQLVAQPSAMDVDDAPGSYTQTPHTGQTHDTHDTSGYHSTDSRRNLDDDDDDGDDHADVTSTNDEPRDLLSYLQQHERRLQTEFDFRADAGDTGIGDDTRNIKQRPKSDTALSSRAAKGRRQGAGPTPRRGASPRSPRKPQSPPTSFRQKVRQGTPRFGLNIVPPKDFSLRRVTSPPLNRASIESDTPPIPPPRRRRNRRAKPKYRDTYESRPVYEQDRDEYGRRGVYEYGIGADCVDIDMMRADVSRSDSAAPQRPWGRGRYTNKSSESRRHADAHGYYDSSLFKYGESMRLPIEELVESDDDVRAPGVVETYDLRSLHTDSEYDVNRSQADNGSLHKEKSLLSLDTQDDVMIQERWDRAAMLQSMRAASQRGQGHVCVCRVCAEVLLLPGIMGVVWSRGRGHESLACL